jgi:hypothetical protein
MLLGAAAAAKTDLAGLKMVIGGSALPKALAKQALAAGIDIYAGYGIDLQWESERPADSVLAVAVLVIDLVTIALGWLIVWGCVALARWVRRVCSTAPIIGMAKNAQEICCCPNRERRRCRPGNSDAVQGRSEAADALPDVAIGETLKVPIEDLLIRSLDDRRVPQLFEDQRILIG